MTSPSIASAARQNAMSVRADLTVDRLTILESVTPPD